MDTVGTALPREMARVRELLPIYDGLPGGAGMFAATLMRADLDKAANALAEGDVVAMIRIYADLTGYKS